MRKALTANETVAEADTKARLAKVNASDVSKVRAPTLMTESVHTL